MNARGAPVIGAALVLALVGAGTCHALSLRSSAAEAFLGDVAPGTTVVFSRAAGARLRVENSGRDPARVEFKVVSPPPGGLRDGFEPWPYPDRIRATVSRAELKPGEAAEAELAVTVPKESALIGGQYEFDVMATGFDRAGASLTLKTRVLLSVGAPLPSAEVTAGGFAERPGFTLAPPSASGKETTLKLVNAGEEDLTATLSPARDWDETVRIREGYEPAPNPRWLRFDPGVVKVRAGAIGVARIWTDVPRQTRYAGRRWAFVTAVDAVAGGRRTRRYFVLYVNADEMEEKTRVR
jgi:hypothetical protein